MLVYTIKLLNQSINRLTDPYHKAPRIIIWLSYLYVGPYINKQACFDLYISYE